MENPSRVAERLRNTDGKANQEHDALSLRGEAHGRTGEGGAEREENRAALEAAHHREFGDAEPGREVGRHKTTITHIKPVSYLEKVFSLEKNKNQPASP